ncbi:MAG TPA: MBL fold metallo-hydrolase [Thermomicrobiales bacterium]|nr:MBL fold metallo-hydrolase [Thermomicrobiales bacterium]
MAEIRWLGHNCFRIRAREATVLMDPVGKKTGFTMARQTADIVTLSHQHAGHTNLEAVKPEYQVIDGPGEYELHGVFITGIRSYHDRNKGTEGGYNTIYRVEFDGLKFGHLGDLGHPLNDDQIESLSSVDILFVPAGGGPLLPPSEMAEVVGGISPRMIIPMQYRAGKGDQSRDPVEPFCKHLGAEVPQPLEKLVVKASDLADQMQLVLLTPDG